MSLLEIGVDARMQRSSADVQPVASPTRNKQTHNIHAWTTMPSCVSWKLLLHINCWLAVSCCLWRSCGAVELPGIYWNATNPIFRIDNTDHIIDVNKSPGEYDRVNIRCPSSSSGSGELMDSYYIIYNVSREEYETCRVINPAARRILVCDQPRANADTRSYITITFRPFTPQPNGLEFHAGQDYYFISTSTGEESGLDNRAGGRCASDNMRLIFKVAGKEQPVGGDSSSTDERVTVKKPISTTFRLPISDQFLPAYETVPDELLPSPTIPPFFRIRTTPYRPRIMKYTPRPPTIAPFVEEEDNELPPVRPSEINYLDRFGNTGADWRRRRTKTRTTTIEYFNVIREEDAAIPAKQTRPRPPHVNSSPSAMPSPLFYGTLLAALLVVL